MTLTVLYLGLLLAGIICFVLHYVAPFRLARRLRQNYPEHWKIIDAGGAAHGPRLWLRMQHVLRSPAIPAIGDTTVTRLWRVWRYSQWLAWACWIAALTLQWFSRH
ncbi:MAG: hypothetical protein WA777_07255 [Rhodanobacter sp.]